MMSIPDVSLFRNSFWQKSRVMMFSYDPLRDYILVPQLDFSICLAFVCASRRFIICFCRRSTVMISLHAYFHEFLLLLFSASKLWIES